MGGILVNIMKNIRVGVLRGGPSSEYDVSLKTGACVLKHLPEHYTGRDVLLSKEGTWHLDGDPLGHERVFDAVDVIFNALHGEYGEDGKVQQFLQKHGVRYTGTGPYGSALAMNKILSKKAIENVGVRTSPWMVGDISQHDTQEIARAAHRKLSPPWVIKEPTGGSSIGVYIVRTADELLHRLERVFLGGTEKVLIEQYVMGREATCGIIDQFRGTKRYILPVIEIVPPTERTFFDYECKYDGSTKEICPARFTKEEKQAIEKAALASYEALGLSDYARIDFILTKSGPYFLEANTLPGLTDESLLPKAVDAVGSNYGELLDHLISIALR